MCVGFDADEQECLRLNSRRMPYRVRFLPVTLGATDGEAATLHVCRQPGCSSLLRPDVTYCSRFAYGPNLEVVETVAVKLSRLDTVCGDYRPDVLKIDTQGSELAILTGAGSMLGSTSLVELEVEFAPVYVNQPLFGAVDNFMRSQGFELLGIRRSYWRRIHEHGKSPKGGQLIHGDALYWNSESNPSENLLMALDPGAAGRLIRGQGIGRRFVDSLLSGWSNRELRRSVDSIRRPDATD